MKKTKQKLLISQLDSKLDFYKPLVSVSVPEKGWIHTIRNAYKMSLRQLGVRLSITAHLITTTLEWAIHILTSLGLR